MPDGQSVIYLEIERMDDDTRPSFSQQFNAKDECQKESEYRFVINKTSIRH